MTVRSLIGLFVLGLAVATHGAVDPAAKCQAAKAKATGKKVYDKMKCHQKAFLKSAAVDPACLTKAETKFSAAVAKADAAGSCPGTEAALEADVDACVGTLVAGVTPCTGETVGGFCWYFGAPGDDCDTTCSAQGRSYDAATASYAGSGGTAAHCDEVMAALGAPDTSSTDQGSCSEGFGCAYAGMSMFLARCANPSTDSTAADPDVRRACACQ